MMMMIMMRVMMRVIMGSYWKPSALGLIDSRGVQSERR